MASDIDEILNKFGSAILQVPMAGMIVPPSTVVDYEVRFTEGGSHPAP